MIKTKLEKRFQSIERSIFRLHFEDAECFVLENFFEIFPIQAGAETNFEAESRMPTRNERRRVSDPVVRYLK